MSEEVSFHFSTTGVQGVENWFLRLIHRAPRDSGRAIQEMGSEALASFRSFYTQAGIRIITGEYLGSVHVDYQTAGNVSSATLSSSHPAAARLEYGFMEEDAIGRIYHQPPRPHWRPTQQRLEQIAHKKVLDAIVGGIRVK